MQVSELIKSARAAAHMTQSQLAQRAGTSQPTVAAYETGAKSPSVRTLEKLIRACGMTLEVRVRKAPVADGELLRHVRAQQRNLREAATRRKIRNVRVFGSTARGDESEDSDIDLLVEFDTRTHGASALAGFRRDAQAILGRNVDVSTPEMLRDDIRPRVLAEAVPL